MPGSKTLELSIPSASSSKKRDYKTETTLKRSNFCTAHIKRSYILNDLLQY